jgi:hypothetical protein
MPCINKVVCSIERTAFHKVSAVRSENSANSVSGDADVFGRHELGDLADTRQQAKRGTGPV